MKKSLRFLLIVSLILLGWALWLALGSATRFEDKEKILYIGLGENGKHFVMQQLKDSGFIRNIALFELIGNKTGVWQKLKPGRYAITKGMSLLKLARNLRNHQQSPVQLTITKLRTKEQFAALLDKKTMYAAYDFLKLLRDSAFTGKYGLDTNTIMTSIFPNTYEILWTTKPEIILDKLAKQRTIFWNETRKQKAKQLQKTQEEIYILASIVEEETNQNDEKPIIASVYLNRLNKSMYLGADPTIKYALRNFGLKRILFVHISSSAGNPYNTYRNKGLPPGPICTPSEASIDAVLNAAKTDYLFFCAQPGGTGYHNFASNETAHFQNAKKYQQWLNSRNIK